jgi:hypothetical protein
MAGCGGLSAGVRNPGQPLRTAAAEPSGVSAAGSAAVQPQRRGGHAGRTPTASHVRPAGTVVVGGVRSPVNSPGCPTPRRTRPPQRRRRRWPSCGTGPDTDRRCGAGGGHPRYPARPADRSVSSGTRTSGHDRRGRAAGAQRFRPGGGNGTGCRTPDRSRSHPARTPRPPAGRRGRTGQDVGSSGRSIRRSVRLVTTFSALPSRPASGRPAAALGRHSLHLVRVRYRHNSARSRAASL